MKCKLKLYRLQEIHWDQQNDSGAKCYTGYDEHLVLRVCHRGNQRFSRHLGGLGGGGGEVTIEAH